VGHPLMSRMPRSCDRRVFCGPMSTFETPRSWTTTGTAETVVMPRRHLVAIAVLMCVPLPLLSLAAMFVPLPQMVERAAATFVSLAAPEFDGGGSLIRERAVAARSVEITYRLSEHDVSSSANDSAARAGSSSSTRTAPAREDFSRTATQVGDAGTGVEPADPQVGATDGPGETDAPASGGDPGSLDPPTGGPTDGQPDPGSSAEPPGSAPPSGGGTRGGSGSSGGGQPSPPSAGGTPPGDRSGGGGPGTGDGGPGTPAADPGTGTGSPPESPPSGGGAPPSDGRGKP